MKKNKSILITGGCGFVGTNLAIYLQKKLKNFSIYSVDNLKKKYSKFNLDILKKKKLKILKLIYLHQNF